MTSDTDRNLSPGTSVDSSLQARKRVRYVLPKGCIIGGSYCIEKPLGHGGMGEVYLARHMKLDIYRAIKILLPKIAVKNPVFATRFMREARLAIQLQHPNIINVMDADYDERLSIYYIVMEFVDGGTVRNLIRKKGPLDEQEVLRIVLRVGEALAVGEEHKIVHRDIKPDNIMLTQENLVKLADLGIAKSSADNSEVDVTSPEVLIGTPAYVSPEQAKDAQHVDSRADIYSLGVSMYEMLTGEKPYKGKTTIEILHQLFDSDVPEVRQKNKAVSKKVSDLVFRMMAKEKEKRPRSWRVFCREVTKLLGDDNPAAMETATTSVEDISALFPDRKNIVLGDEGAKPLFDKKKVKKAAKYGAVALLSFTACFILISGVLSPNNLAEFRDTAALLLIGEKYRQQCKKYHLSPPLYLVLTSGDLKQAWIDQNIPEEKEKTIRIDHQKTSRKTQQYQSSDYSGHGTLEFKIAASPEAEIFLKDKKLQLEVSAGKHFSPMKIFLPDSVSVPAGIFTLQLNIPHCKKFPPQKVKLENGETITMPVHIVPEEGTIVINSSVSGVEVWWNNKWLKQKELKVDSLKNIDIIVRAAGYKLFTSHQKLQPGERRYINVALEKLPALKKNSQLMRRANEEFEKKNYATAKKLYRREAENGNPEAMYKMGIIYDQGLGEWFANKQRAFQYYRMAADQEHAEAIYKVAEFHEHGMGRITKDAQKALQWYKRSAELNHLPSLVKIGLFYDNGIGGLRHDQDTALTYFLRAAEKGYAEAQYRAARIYEQKMMSDSLQHQRDEHKKLAKRFYEEASQQNWGDAKSRLRAL